MPATGRSVKNARTAATIAHAKDASSRWIERRKMSTRLYTMNIIARAIASAAAGVAAISAIGAASPAAAVTPLNIAAEARIALLAKGYNATGQQLFAQFSATRGNIVFSPYSIGAA